MSELISRIHDRLLSDSKAKRSPDGKKINFIECPECGQREAFAYYDNPFAIICHRNDNCGVTTTIKHAHPDLFENFAKHYPATKTNPNLTAERYLESRGLDISKIAFSQSSYKIDSKHYQTVVFEQDGVKQHRLIDYPHKDKNRTVTAFKNKVYETTDCTESLTIYITEGIIDALSLRQAGEPAIATYSSGSVPEEYFERNRLKQFVIAFDNDTAGKSGIASTIACFKKIGIDYKVALPPEGKDWNDLVVSGDLSAEKLNLTLDRALWRGRLFEAQTPTGYFEILNEHQRQAIFEYRKSLYLGWFKTIKSKEQEDGSVAEDRIAKTMQLADCSLRLRYSIVDDSIQNNLQTTNIIEIESLRTKTILSEFNAKEMASPAYFREKLAHYKQTTRATQDHLIQIQQYLYDQPAPMVRKLQSVGYDPKSGCYVFGHFLYDKTGKRHNLNKFGYFSQQKIMPFKDSYAIETITEASPADVRKFITALAETWGTNGLLSLGFYVSTLFSHHLFARYKSYPILNLYHANDTGKSTLINILNKMCFVDWYGIPIGGNNTKKGELRKISQKNSLVTPLSEFSLASPKNIFDPDQNILNAYNRLSLEIRAQRTNGNETIEIPFNGALCFVQNDYPFTTKQGQERVVDLRFEENSLNTKSESFKYLTALKPADVQGIGDYILKNRLFFEDKLMKITEKATEKLGEAEIKNRIAVNYAMVYAGVNALATLAKAPPERITELFTDTQKIALAKIQTSSHKLDIADYFFSLVDRMTASGTTGIARAGEQLYLNMPLVLKHVKEHYGDSLSKDTLFTELRSHERFVKANFAKQIDWDGDKRVTKVWEFKAPTETISTEPAAEKVLDYADLFLETLESLSSLDGVVRGEPGDGHLYVNMSKALARIRNDRMMRVDEPRLLAELRQHPRFIKNNHREADNPLLKGLCWVFEQAPI